MCVCRERKGAFDKSTFGNQQLKITEVSIMLRKVYIYSIYM